MATNPTNQQKLDDTHAHAQYLDVKSSALPEKVWNHPIYNREYKKNEYAETHLGSMQDRLNTSLASMEKRLTAQIAAAAKSASGQSVDMDEVKEAARLGSAESSAAVKAEVLAAINDIGISMTQAIEGLDVSDDVKRALTESVASITHTQTEVNLKEQP